MIYGLQPTNDIWVGILKWYMYIGWNTKWYMGWNLRMIYELEVGTLEGYIGWNLRMIYWLEPANDILVGTCEWYWVIYGLEPLNDLQIWACELVDCKSEFTHFMSSGKFLIILCLGIIRVTLYIMSSGKLIIFVIRETFRLCHQGSPLYCNQGNPLYCIPTGFICSANVTVQLDTNQVRGFLFPAQAHFQWPNLVKKSKYKFPLTQIGNVSVSYSTLDKIVKFSNIFFMVQFIFL